MIKIARLIRRCSVEIENSTKLSQGLLEITSEPPGPVIWIPLLNLQKNNYLITKKSTSIGRASDADVRVNMKGVSRYHAKIRWDGKSAELLDLASTNGTKLDGKVVSRAALPDRCFIEVGKTRILFEIVARIESAAHQPIVRGPQSLSGIGFAIGFAAGCSLVRFPIILKQFFVLFFLH